jgi:ABC-type uncharacterized transport system substrate-binding protein
MQMNLITALNHTKAGAFFILLISALLLLLDLDSRTQKENDVPRIAVFKLSSRPLLDNTEKGIVEGLQKAGFVNGNNVSITHFCAENDLPTANTIAQNILNDQFDMVITISTPILQVMANANQEGEIIHVFGAVTDPFASGVGLSREHPTVRPAHLAGIGTFQPVEDGLLIAREMNPHLNILGVPWCSHEVCSEACVKIARKVGDSLQIELKEVTVDNSSAVYEAVQSLISRGAEAIWVGGDNTVEIAMDMIVKATDDAGIPVFCNNPDMPAKGALFGLGANYYEVGEATAQVAAQILNGAEPASIPVKNVVPEKLYINESKISGLDQKWMITEKLRNRADKILN